MTSLSQKIYTQLPVGLQNCGGFQPMDTDGEIEDLEVNLPRNLTNSNTGRDSRKSNGMITNRYSLES